MHVDDSDLLSEMALYEDGEQQPSGVVGVVKQLSDSRNDDDLLLQMEEFM